MKKVILNVKNISDKVILDCDNMLGITEQLKENYRSGTREILKQVEVGKREFNDHTTEQTYQTYGAVFGVESFTAGIGLFDKEIGKSFVSFINKFIEIEKPC